MIFFVVNDGDNIWMNVLFTGLCEIPCLFIVALLVEYGPRKVLYLIIYLTSGVAAGALFFTNESKSLNNGHTVIRVVLLGVTRNNSCF